MQMEWFLQPFAAVNDSVTLIPGRLADAIHESGLIVFVRRCCIRIEWTLVWIYRSHVCMKSASHTVKPKFHLARHVTSRHDTTRSTCRASRARRVERVEPCCLKSSTQPKCMGSTCRTCRVVSRRDVTRQVEFGLMMSQLCCWRSY